MPSRKEKRAQCDRLVRGIVELLPVLLHVFRKIVVSEITERKLKRSIREPEIAANYVG